MHCKHCGEKYSEEDAYCGGCGRKVGHHPPSSEKRVSPAKEADSLKISAILFFGLMILFLILDLTAKTLPIKLTYELLLFISIIITLILSKKLRNKGEKDIGTPIFVIALILLFIYLLMFIIGAIGGFMLASRIA